jgi:hypothetical protein
MVRIGGNCWAAGVWTFVAALGLLAVAGSARADTLQTTEHEISATPDFKLRLILGYDGPLNYVVYSTFVLKFQK